MIYKASIYRFLMIHILSGLIILIFTFPLFKNIESSIALMLAILISGVLAVFLIDCRRKNIVLSDSFIEGPFRVKLYDIRISLGYEQINIENCIRPSIIKNGAIVAKDGRRIIIYSMFFGKQAYNQIFNEIEAKTNSLLHEGVKKCDP